MKSSKGKIIELLEKEFSDIKFMYKKVVISGDIHVFVIQVEKESTLEDIWVGIRDFIAIYFQNELNSEFERWNLYLIFLAEGKIPKKLKYKIENDPVSSRKIVVEDYNYKLTEKRISSLLSKFIGIAVSLPTQNKENKKKYSSNSTVFKLVDKKKLPKSGASRKKELEKLHEKLSNQLS